MKKKAAIFLALCVLAHVAFAEIPNVFYLNVTASLPTGLYMRIPSGEIRRGDYIVYEPSQTVKEIVVKNGWGDGRHDFLKKVGAVAGDTYSINAKTLVFEAAGKYVGMVYETDNRGNPLPKLRGEFVVPEGCVLPVATSARSFDGRYSGAIEKSRIKAKVVPILVW